MPKQIIIAEQHRIAAVFSEDQIQELIVAKGTHQVGDIYVGTVENVLPGIDAAFVNIGDAERNGFIHVSDLGPLRLRRAAGSITELLAPQQKVLVQIMKEPTGNKGPRLTGNITLPGRYLVLMPFGRGVNLSRRIRSENERNRLRALAILLKPAGMGLLVRTEAEGVSEEGIIEDLEALQRQWENIQQEAMTTRPPNLLNRDDDFIQRVLRDMYSGDVNRIVVDSHTGLKRVKHHLTNWNGGRSPQGVLIDHHRDRVPILEYFRVNAAIREALKPRVDLPSGGYIIIEPTEALTVIDVNSGSFTRSATARETVLWTNSEAAVEIARQLRLRNIAGVIIIDFIDMDSRRDQLQVLESFNRALRADKARPQIAQLSELGLVELTRKRQGQNIYELFGQTCPTCGGLGHIVHLPGEVDSPAHEITEAPPSYPAVEAHTALPTEVWDGQGDEGDLDASPDLQELDLVNHPSYQERGSSNRRRRRRRAPSEPVTASRTTTPVRAESSGGDVAEPESAATANGESPRKESRPERTERSDRRSSNRRDKSSSASEVVFVEMTPQEQDIYALMGISPLVLATEPVKSPKNAIVNVVLPGQERRTESQPEEDSNHDNGASSNGSSSPVTNGSKENSPSPKKKVILPSEKTTSTPEKADSASEEHAVAVAIADTSNSLDEASETEHESENSSASRRRRRRRSSAAEASS
ncbi:MAG: ribonuclease E/G [Elainellaceae cyanobacterium]